MGQFSPLQPGVLKFTMEALAERWPEWDDEAGRFSPGESTACWPEREVVAAEILRVLNDAGFVKGVLQSDYLHSEGESEA